MARFELYRGSGIVILPAQFGSQEVPVSVYLWRERLTCGPIEWGGSGRATGAEATQLLTQAHMSRALLKLRISRGGTVEESDIRTGDARPRGGGVDIEIWGQDGAPFTETEG
jgi:hypothetical protein